MTSHPFPSGVVGTAQVRPSPTATRRTALAVLAGTAFVPATRAEGGGEAPSPAIRHGRIRADGVDVFYREAGPSDAPVLLLLHGFANSSFYFRHLMPRLSDRFLLVAPDLPSFGFTEVPPERGYRYDFASLSRTIGAFVDAMGLRRYALYVFDYGAPVGWDLAMAHPERITGIVSQGGNAYVDGLADGAWGPLRAYWAEPSEGPRAAIRARMSLDGVKAAYFEGVPEATRIEPEAYTLDAAILARPGNADLQVDLKLDYKRNIELYPRVQEYFRTHRPGLLAVWGRNDPFFVPAGAEAFKRDLPDARVKLLDAGHFALETDMEPIAAEIRRFL